MTRNGSLTNSTIFAISDRELLFVVHDHRSGEPDRREQITEIIQTLNLRHENARQSLSIRLGYMARIGLVEKQGSDRWRLTATGLNFTKGQLSKTDRATIGRLLREGNKLPAALHAIGQSARQYENDPLGYVLRRQWRHSTGRN